MLNQTTRNGYLFGIVFVLNLRFFLLETPVACQVICLVIHWVILLTFSLKPRLLVNNQCLSSRLSVKSLNLTWLDLRVQTNHQTSSTKNSVFSLSLGDLYPLHNSSSRLNGQCTVTSDEFQRTSELFSSFASIEGGDFFSSFNYCLSINCLPHTKILSSHQISP